MLELYLPKFWQKKTIVSYLLWPISLGYCLFVELRKIYFRLVKIHKFPVPIVVVGNLTVGGSGKTPLVIYLVNLLKSNGYNPGIVSRGYGRKNTKEIFFVKPESSVDDVGDEALLIMRRTRSPMVVGIDRVGAVQMLLDNHQCDVVISDDGLQHYNLDRYLEIAVIDADYQFGNGLCLPAGPLRELPGRLKSVDFVVKNFNTTQSYGVEDGLRMFLVPTTLRNVKNPEKTASLQDFKGITVHGVAAIGRPEKFFRTLTDAGLDVIKHSFPDHHVFNNEDFSFADSQTVIMTEKDAVKCGRIPLDDFWYLEVDAKLDDDFTTEFLSKIKSFSKLASNL